MISVYEEIGTYSLNGGYSTEKSTTHHAKHNAERNKSRRVITSFHLYVLIMKSSSRQWI